MYLFTRRVMAQWQILLMGGWEVACLMFESHLLLFLKKYMEYLEVRS
jgi:hypothetical protein